MTRKTTFLVAGAGACCLVMAAVSLASAAQSNSCLASPQNTSDPCAAEYTSIPPSGLGPDLFVYCSSASGSCSNSTDMTQWRAQVYPTAVRVLSQGQVPGLLAQVSSGDVAWCFDYAVDDSNGSYWSDFTFFPGSCNVTAGHVADTKLFVGVGKTPSLPQGAPVQLGRLQNAYTGNGTFYIGIPPGPQNGTVPDNANLVVWTKSQFDQLWIVPSGGGAIYDAYKDTSGKHVCLHAASYQQGATITDAPCTSAFQPTDPLSYWQTLGSNKFTGDPHPGCFVLYNPYTGYAIGVQNGNGSVNNGGALVQWPYDGTANQFWCVK